VVASLFPDIDQWLTKPFPGGVHHHGVTQTVVFVTVAALVGAAIVAAPLPGRVEDRTESERVNRSRLFAVSFPALLAGGLSHVFADMLSAPDVARSSEPPWPLVDGSRGIDLVRHNASRINVGFPAVMLIVHVGVAYLTTPAAHWHRLRSA